MATLASSYAPPRRRFLPAWLWPAAGDAGVEHLSLVRCGLAILFLDLSLMFIPGQVYGVCRFIFHPLALLWLCMAIPRMTRRIRFAFPFYCLLILQIWMVVAMLFAQQAIPKPPYTGEYLWFPLENGVIYLLVVGLGTLMPGSVRYIINFFLSICALSSFVAILQAAHFGPFIRLADFYVYRSIEDWDNVSGIRASGLSSDPNTNLLSLMVAATLIAYKSSKRSLTKVDWTLWGMFILASFVAQHRSSMPLLAITFVVTLIIMLRKKPQALVAAFSISLLLFGLAITVGRKNFAYTFETQWSSDTPQLVSREREEQHALKVFMDYPIFGIGPTPTPETFGVGRTDFDFKVENLYYAILLTMGVPGLVLVLTAYAGALVQCLAYILSNRLDYARKVIAVVGALGALNLLWNGNVKVNIGTHMVMFTYMALLGVVQIILTGETENSKRRRRVSPYIQQHRDDQTSLVRM